MDPSAGDPPLLLTHVPLLQVPHGAANVHGHVHEQESPTPNRHVNVSVEQLNYWPVRLSEIRGLARQLVEGRTAPGHSTRARLNVVERGMRCVNGRNKLKNEEQQDDRDNGDHDDE